MPCQVSHVREITLENPFSPQQRVIVCREEYGEPSESVGYYGTVVRILADAKLRYPDQPSLWDYRVFVPFLDQQLTVPGRQLVSTGILGESIEDLDWKICFDTIPTDDNSEITGSYRIPNSGTTYFKFRKTDCDTETYRLAIQIAISPPESKLFFNVPLNTQLTANYVRATIRRILGLSDNQTSKCNVTKL